MTRVAIIDYGMGNLFSVTGAFSEIGASVNIAQSPCELRDADHIILPGVGSFKLAMKKITAAGFDDALQEALVRQKKVLGICLGMQLLFSHGKEGGDTEGLGILDGVVSRITTKSMPVPHVGFNNVTASEDSILLNGVNGADFYFVHSYKCEIEAQQPGLAGSVEYEDTILALFENENTFATQFHPEKSQKNGLRLLENFLKL